MYFNQELIKKNRGKNAGFPAKLQKSHPWVLATTLLITVQFSKFKIHQNQHKGLQNTVKLYE